MSSSKLLVRQIRQLGSDLKKAARWHGSMEPVDVVKDDYLYELCCFFKLALASSSQFEIKLAGKTIDYKGELAARWPKKPGHKKNFSYLSLVDAANTQEAFQLCPGINIEDKHKKLRAPDITLLKAGTRESPICADVHAIWDAKYTIRNSSKLPDSAVADFIFTYQQFESPKTPRSWTNKVTNMEWKKSGLITNADASTEPDAVLMEYGISETSNFPDGPLKTRP